MYVFGGITEKNTFMNDSMIFDLNNFRWTRLQTKGDRPTPRAFMNACLVVIPERLIIDSLCVYKLPEISLKNDAKKIKYEGVYIFGGVTEDNICSNEIYCLKIGKKPVTWIKLETKGYIPPRYGCSMNLHNNWLIIHGGKNDKSENFYFSDTYLFDIMTFTWFEITISGSKPLSRHFHSAVVHGSNLIIFGGMDDVYFHSSQLYVINLNFSDRKTGRIQYDDETLYNKENLVNPKRYTSLNKANTEELIKRKIPKKETLDKINSKGYLNYIKNLKISLKKEMNHKIKEKNRRKVEQEIEMKFGKIKDNELYSKTIKDK